MGPFKCVSNYIENHPEVKELHVTLYGSLAATGKGHLTDVAVIDACENRPVTIDWEPKVNLPEHPNGMIVSMVNENGERQDPWTYYSVGGGDIVCIENPIQTDDNAEVYEMTTMKEILHWCNATGRSFWEFVDEHEKNTPGFWEYLEKVWKTMQKAVERGIDEEGALPGPLNLRRKAGSYYIKADGYGDVLRTRGLIFAYALAVSEENACGGTIVTGPTCGSCGVLPGALYHLKKVYGFSDQRIIRALATAGIIGNIVKHNASISGAEVGCQGEVGVACAMAAAAITQLMGGSPSQIEYAAEMGLEHHLGLTCDPVGGLVQIPCIERNAYAAARAMDASIYSLYTDGRHRVSFDQVVKVMKETGKDLPSVYKETSEGGLAKHLD
jgi:L-serine dehydratase